PIVLFRALLRQIGVLHDDTARNWFRQHVKKRFAVSRDAEAKRLVQLLAETRRGITTLKRANQGFPKPLLKVMEIAWGRNGKRRHELMDVSSGPFLYAYPRKKLPFMSKPFEALVKWVNVKNPELKIPEKNIWDEPFPEVRLPRIYGRHFNRLVTASPAPLPLEEFERLKRLASGQELPKPPRRKRPLSEESRKCKAINGERPHEMKPRSWRRIYQKILNKSVALVYNEPREKWEVIAQDPKALPEIDNDEIDDF
ncbi:hypothetical protein FN846DRAFT_755677, partial [Sphaerosporella brunnea]